MIGTRARDGDVRLVLFFRSGSPLFWTSRPYVANDGARVIGRDSNYGRFMTTIAPSMSTTSYVLRVAL
jgi:hypothetical protein